VTNDSGNNKKILLVEDDRDLASLITMHLRQEGFRVRVAADGKFGLDQFLAEKWTLVILDWMLPGMSGLDVLRDIRVHDRITPVLMLTARDEEADKVLGLELGCDDYMTKPFGLRELVARINVLRRRVELAAEIAAGAEQMRELDFGSLRIEPAKRKVTVDGNPVSLTLKEFDLLYTLSSKPGRTFSRSQLLDLVWDCNAEVYEHTVNSHINRLRGKIEANPNRPRYILTAWGAGYRFTEDF